MVLTAVVAEWSGSFVLRVARRLLGSRRACQLEPSRLALARLALGKRGRRGHIRERIARQGGVGSIGNA